jgi:hypothetical protein
VLRKLITLVVLYVACGAVEANESKGLPDEAKSTAAILKGVESAKGFGVVSTVEFHRGDTKLFLVWYNPYSGRAACHVHGYAFDAKKGRWVRHLRRVFVGTPNVSVEAGAAIRFGMPWGLWSTKRRRSTEPNQILKPTGATH